MHRHHLHHIPMSSGGTAKAADLAADFGGWFAEGGELGGRGFGMGRKLASADLQLLILGLLAEKPRHGYEIIKALDELSRGFYAPSPGMVYPALTYVEERVMPRSRPRAPASAITSPRAADDTSRRSRARSTPYSRNSSGSASGCRACGMPCGAARPRVRAHG